jgi:hypothetical protein
MVINLSNVKLTFSQISVLNKGLGFVPSHIKPNFNTIDADLKRFERKLQLHHHFYKGVDKSPSTHLHNSLFSGNPKWWPKKLNPHITSFCNNIKNHIFKLLKHKTKVNLNSKEIKALSEISRNNNIIIKKCDKGGGIAIMNKLEYKEKILIQLNDTNIYTPVTEYSILTDKQDTDSLLYTLTLDNIINNKQFRHLTDFEPRIPLFYGLPKVHKPEWPLRPIISQINAPTYKLNELVDKYLTIAEHSIPFLLQDTTAYLNFLQQIDNINEHTYLVTLDVVSLYTNIPHEEGATYVSEYYEETLHLWSSLNYSGLIPLSKHTIYTFIKFILQHCTFEFDGKLYKQNYGTTMGAKFSVKFANIYMYIWLRKALISYQGLKPTNIARLVDDCFFIWNHSLDSLNTFITYLNNIHDTIKFVLTYSKTNINFLDTTTYIENFTIKTKIFTKPTDKKQYLHYNSDHPLHTKLAIPYAQSIRIKRNTTDPLELNIALENLKLTLINRGYPLHIIIDEINKIHHIKRLELLQYKDKKLKTINFNKWLNGKTFLPLIITNHTNLSTNNVLKNILHQEWLQFCESDEHIKLIFSPELPQVVFKRGKTIGNALVATKFDNNTYTLNNTVEILASLLLENENLQTQFHTIQQCKSKNCKCCIHMDCTYKFSNFNNSKEFFIDHDFNCNSSNLVYLITCSKCKLQYVGQTKRALRERLNNHRSNIKLKLNTAIAIHFNQPSHSITNLKIKPIIDITNSTVQECNDTELKWILKLNSKYPFGINFYPLIK